MDNKTILAEGKAVLGIEFGSTRIKAVVSDAEGNVLAQGGHGILYAEYLLGIRMGAR